MFEELCKYGDILKISASNPKNKDCKFLRIVISAVSIKGGLVFQAEKFNGKQVFHENLQPSDLRKWVAENIAEKYKQVVVNTRESQITYLTSSNGAVKRLVRKNENAVPSVKTNNRRKNYLINEGDDVPVLIDLGIFTKDRKIVNSMYDKFKQINRFAEILNDVFKDFDGKELTMLDFGCGKSYLTFVVYYYLSQIKHIKTTIIGYDLKADVVENCNILARKYRYEGLQFVTADVSKDKLYDKKIDAVISLHACDTATDYALHYAVKHNVKYIFSVPCCQHEINKTINFGGGELDSLLKYGIVKERVSALLTDSIRAMLLEDEGYSVDVMEFVDFAHSPKNIMIRAVKTHGCSNNNRVKIEDLMRRYGFKQKLYTLLSDKTDIE